MHIVLNNNKKIKSPLAKSDVFSYEGPIEGVDLYRQKRNFRLISEKLNLHNIFLDYIWFAKFRRQEKVEYHFVAKSNDNRIHWRKYAGNAAGSGQNYIYIDGTEQRDMWDHDTEGKKGNYVKKILDKKYNVDYDDIHNG